MEIIKSKTEDKYIVYDKINFILFYHIRTPVIIRIGHFEYCPKKKEYVFIKNVFSLHLANQKLKDLLIISNGLNKQ